MVRAIDYASTELVESPVRTGRSSVKNLLAKRLEVVGPCWRVVSEIFDSGI
jgi:hypothetical protein